MKPLAPRFEAAAWWLNDLLEHLVIIPEEQKYAQSESYEHWTRECNEVLYEIASTWMIPPNVVKQRLFGLRSMHDIALPDWKTSQLFTMLTSRGLLEASEQFVAMVRREINQKIELICHVASEFEYDSAGFEIFRFDVSAHPRKTRKVASLPVSM